MNTFISILTGIGLWLLIFLPSNFIGSLISNAISKRKKLKLTYSGAIIQTLFIIFSLLVFLTVFKCEFISFGLTFNFHYILTSFAVAIPTSFILLLVLSRILSPKSSNEAPFAIENLADGVILVILAPIGEEMLFRGVFEGYLLLYGVGLWLSIIIPAIFFSSIHVVPFSKASRRLLIMVLLLAFILGVLAGYFRAVSSSLLPAMVTHSSFNVSGILVSKKVIRMNHLSGMQK